MKPKKNAKDVKGLSLKSIRLAMIMLVLSITSVFLKVEILQNLTLALAGALILFSIISYAVHKHYND